MLTNTTQPTSTSQENSWFANRKFDLEYRLALRKILGFFEDKKTEDKPTLSVDTEFPDGL